MFEHIQGLDEDRIAYLTALVEECRPLADRDEDMVGVQQLLQQRGLSIIMSILITRELLGPERGSLREAQRIVLSSPARNVNPAKK